MQVFFRLDGRTDQTNLSCLSLNTFAFLFLRRWTVEDCCGQKYRGLLLFAFAMVELSIELSLFLLLAANYCQIVSLLNSLFATVVIT
jgi:hypothetical protein